MTGSPGSPDCDVSHLKPEEPACFIQMERMIFNPGAGQFDPRHPPLAGTFSPEEAAASWKERRVYDPRVDGYVPQLKL
jgi:hypothetical protein